MSEVVAAIKRVTDIMGEISAASTEQSAGVAQVGEAGTQMDQATQQNAALVEESAAAAESLKQQALNLVQAVAVFKLAQYGPGRGAALAPALRSQSVVDQRGPAQAKSIVRSTLKTEPSKHLAASPSPAAAAKSGTDDWASF